METFNGSSEEIKPPKPANEKRKKNYRRIASILAAGSLVTVGAIEAPKFFDNSLAISTKAFGLDQNYSHDKDIKKVDFDGVDFISLLKIKKDKETDRIVLVDTSPNGVNQEVISWMQERIKPMKPLLQTAFDTGTLNQIIIGTEAKPEEEDDDLSLYSQQKKTVLVDIGLSEDSISSEIFDATVMHEVGHSLFAKRPISTLSRGLAKGKSAEKLQKACAVVRSHAIDALESNISQYEHLLQKFGRLNTSYKPAVKELLQAASNNTLDQYYPKKRGAINSYTETPACESLSFSQLIGRIVHKLDLKKKPNIVENSVDVIDEANGIAHDIIRASEIYTAFTDETFTDDQDAGHPYDMLDESAASMFMSTMLYPEALGENIASLSTDQRETLFEYYKNIMKEFKSVKGVSDFLNPKIAIVKENANIS